MFEIDYDSYDFRDGPSAQVNGVEPIVETRIGLSLHPPAAPEPASSQLTELLRKNAQLEGRLEVLSQEAEVAIKERAQCQSRLASVQSKLQVHDTNTKILKPRYLVSFLDQHPGYAAVVCACLPHREGNSMVGPLFSVGIQTRLEYAGG